MTQTGEARLGSSERDTLETRINVQVNLDGDGSARVVTGVPFLDHMLTSLAKHSSIDLSIEARGDTEIDDHHTVEDVGITLGRALRDALGDRVGIGRFGSAYAPMDESLARAVVDISGRAYSVYRAEGLQLYAGNFQTYLAGHFFRSLAHDAGMALHVELLYGTDPHHGLEAIFKAVALALRQAVARAGSDVPSTKGVLD